jgi:haloacetate dehalogenase
LAFGTDFSWPNPSPCLNSSSGPIQIIITYQLDEADRGTKWIQCPVLVLWSKQGELEEWYDVLAIWRDWADDVEGKAIECGHYLAEEAPDETYTELHTFFAL